MDAAGQDAAGTGASPMDRSATTALHRVMEGWAARAPARPAVVCGDDRRDYAMLNAQANRLARHLRTLGVAPERNVGLCMARGAGMLEGLLATWKAGGAYVPMDPEYPAERLRAMVGDAAPAVVLTDAAGRAAMAAALSGLDAAPACVSLEDATHWAAQSADDLDDVDEATVSSRRAYVIYTSGSTGRPKGVEVEHAAVLHLWRSLDALLHPDGRDATRPLRAAMNASLSFDVSVQGWSRLLSGDCVVVVPQSAKQDPEAMLALLESEGVDLFDCTPSQLAGLLDAGLQRRERLSALTVVVAGEAIPPAMWRTMASSTTQRFFNAYGPTEATVYATAMAINGAGDAPRIGVALPGVKIGVFDDRLHPVADGDRGELLIAGDGLARGYLARPELTAERFVAIDGERWYRTGDLGRVLADGTIEYQGRNDFQVKVRGFRIELGEIESVLATLPGVRDAVVLARDDAGEKQLVAYVRGDADATPATLREALSTRLPGFMVPSAYVRVDAWPQTGNGKLDRAALRPPAPEDYPSEAYRAPEGETEIALAALWCDLLKREQVGRDDRFLLLGGDSLRLIQLSSRIRQRFGVSLPIHALFRPMTLAEMAAGVADAGVSSDGSGDTLPGASFDAWVPPADGLPARAPLSYQQQGLWLLEKLSSTSTAYNAQNVIRIHGRFDPQRFGRAVAMLAERHEILRTTFHAGADGEPYQQVHASAPGMFEYRALDADGPVGDDVIAGLVDAHVHHRFDLALLPLIRFSLFRLAPDEYLLIQVEQHYVHDGWSMNLILRELLAIHDALGRGETPGLPPMAAQFRDYALWQHGDDARARLQAQAAYWKRKLDGAPLQLAMPTDFPRPPVQSYRGDQVRVVLPIAFARALRAFCQREGVTLFATMQAVYRMTIARHIGAEDFVIGSAVANRTSQKCEGLVGMFVNMIPARCDVSGDPTWRALISRVMNDLAEDYEHQEVPFEWVVREVQPERDFSRNPLFQTAFSTHNSPGPRLDWPDFRMRIHEVYSNDTSKFDFDVVMIPRSTDDADGITLFWEYSVDLYRRETIERLHAWYMAALAMCIAQPGQRLSEAEPLPDMHARGIDGGLRPLATPVVTPVQARFEAFAARVPEAEAVRCGDASVTYGELDARADRLAHWLRAQGVAPERRVAIVQDKSIALVESVLATLKSGGAYLPFDVATPPERLARVLRDAAPTIVLTDAAAQATVAEAVAQLGSDAPRVVRVDRDAAAWADAPARAPDPTMVGCTPESLAYVIHTSGSTGEPKGVMVEHRQIAAICAAWEDTCALRPGLRHLQMASPAFDVFTADLLRALSYGGTLVLCPMETVLDAGALYRILRGSRIDVADFVPAVLDALVQHVEAVGGDLHFLSTVVCGSDVWSPEAARRARAVCGPSVRLINAYGLTETAVDATCHVLDADEDGSDLRRARVPIGRPLPGVRVLLLDARLRPVPEGAIGELYIGGAGVARGYLNRDDLTAARFIDNPHAPGERLYRTGDLARLREDGAIEHLGRNDAQLKIRGHRIEPGEIETRLARLPGVREALVVTHGDGPARVLVAYCLCADAAALSAESLRTALRRQLPEHMVPAAYIGLAAWPLGANGKVDRRALPAPDGARMLANAGYVAPRTPLEEEMCRLWARLLGVPRVGVHDNFFALGGHSLMATRLLMETHALLGVALRLRDLFDAPTVERMLEAVFARADMEELAE
jgi:amino acid adenylation domain-containing protein